MLRNLSELKKDSLIQHLPEQVIVSLFKDDCDVSPNQNRIKSRCLKALRNLENYYCSCKEGDTGIGFPRKSQFKWRINISREECKRLQNIFSYHKCYVGYTYEKNDFQLPTNPIFNVCVLSRKNLPLKLKCKVLVLAILFVYGIIKCWSKFISPTSNR